MRYLAIAVAALLSTGTFSYAQTILTRYEFNGGSATPTSHAAGVEASNVTLGRDSSYAVGFSGSGNIYFAGAPNGTSFPNAGWATSSAESVTNQYYSSFSVGGANGMALNLSTLSLNYGGSTYSNDGAGIAPFTVHVELRSSLDNFANSLGEATPLVIKVNSPTSNTPGSYTFDLSNVAGMESVTETITFRLYVWADGYTGDPKYMNSIRLDNFELKGDLHAIPEPGTLSILMGGVLSASLVLYRRNRI